jgi:hypothetical protein
MLHLLDLRLGKNIQWRHGVGPPPFNSEARFRNLMFFKGWQNTFHRSSIKEKSLISMKQKQKKLATYGVTLQYYITQMLCPRGD